MAVPTANQYLTVTRRNRVQPGYVSGLSPKHVPPSAGLNCWYDAAQIAGASNAATFSPWPDMSGNSRDASQATAGNRGIYYTQAMSGKPGVWFDGARSYDITMTTPAWGSSVGTSYIVLFNARANTSVATPFGWSSRTDEYWWYGVNTSYIGMMRSARLEGASIGFTSGIHVITVLSGASAYNVYDNGATLYTGSASWAANATARIGNNLGSNASWLGFIFEILIYNTEHDTDTMQSIWNDLRWKWAIG